MSINVNDLTIGQIKEIQMLLGSGQHGDKKESCYPVGKNVIVRTITMIYTGELFDVTATNLILMKCIWIPETGRYADFVENGSINECEPYPDDMLVYINRGALLDMCEFRSQLPRSQK